MENQRRVEELAAAVRPVDQSLRGAGQRRLDSLAKPPGSLGRLEELALKLWLVQKTLPLRTDPAAICTFAADHGVAEMGVSAYPAEVTRQQVLNMARGGAAISVLCAANGIEHAVVDVGVRGEPVQPRPRLHARRLAPGAGNIAREPAMSRELCLEAILLGAEMAERFAGSGCRVLGCGEMGIGNTTSATALFCALLNLSPDVVTGPGAGLPPGRLAHKREIIGQALSLHARAVSSGDPLAVLAALGGLEIAAMAGFMLAAAARECLVLVDGFICTAAWAAAWKLAPALADYAVFCHASAEPGYQAVMERLGASPLLHFAMRLGEGTGAAVALPLLRSAAAVFNTMATLEAVVAGCVEGP